MAITPGTRLGPYEVTAQIGKGGMGEVYRATDTNLKRAVAIKGLPELVAGDGERLARFQREAEVLASLNHPNIAAIYGLERSAGTTALVMELVEGPTLAERIASSGGPGGLTVGGPKGPPLRTDVPRTDALRTDALRTDAPRTEGRRGGPLGPPIPIDEALSIAKQIAEALEAAHERGIIHRDLKPANIKLRPDGVVKVLDFGLAKALDDVGRGPVGGHPGPADGLTNSPTLSFAATQAGMILGTAGYMSPEQAKGRIVDKRSDVWAFGAVLYEMLTGRRAFEGEDVADTLAAVLMKEPDWAALPATTPPRVTAVLRRCLQKDRKQRARDIGDVALALEGAFEPEVGRVPRLVRRSLGEDGSGPAEAAGSAGATHADPAHVRSMRRRVALGSAAALMAGLIIAGAAVWWTMRPTPPRVVRTTIATSGSTALSLGGADRDVAITPDGSRIVYRGANQLLVRALDQLEPDVLSGLGTPRGVFISPDGQWVGFFDGGSSLKKVAITGGPPVTITPVDGPNPRGATWGPDGTIVFATSAGATGLQRVSAAGGEPTVLTKPDRERGEADHVWPEFLPGGQAVLFTVTAVSGGLDNGQIAVLDLRTGMSTVLIRGGSHAHYVPTGLGSPKLFEREGGHLVYGVAGTLRAVAFDLGRLEVVGTPAPVVEGVVTTAQGAADIAVAANGSLVYVPGAAGGGGQQTIVSVDRQGRDSPLPGIPLDTYRDVRVSPDGARLALATQTEVWTYDFLRATLSRLTTDPAQDMQPLWTPDGQRIIFQSRRAGYPELFWRPADGTGSDERLLTRAKDLVDLIATGWSADGRQLLLIEVSPGSAAGVQCAIGQMAIERPSEVTVLVKNEFCNFYSAVSPDGRWIAYQSNVSGRLEIYVERYPELGSRQQISTGGGARPVWSRNGRELFFSGPDNRQMLAVAVQSGTTLVAGRPQVLFEFAMLPVVGSNRPWDLAPDGRFVIIRSGQAEAGGAPSNLSLVLNWFEELKRLVPTN